ncbi:imidazoleglycerol-phosphate dehydratase [Caloramator quimbayensis]|uniref:Imidazoleglycerol-phosphate dehydratase n=1 Tax=Caloramator quimbayensis TaxID=1147123 RepID=A0A1T4X5W2_9CLOT|nr:imidazoleglycerol-phosphate dehydratase HisB [Caloramator quimbayensis]SKA84946.1 imidazoleglycerol-phosphate dehydratase [Caloramator quimbayensis]
MNRENNITRKTMETQIDMFLNIDGSGKSKIDTKIGFLNHMLNLFSKHGLFDLNIKAIGDIDIDNHHTVEDIGIVLGQVFLKCLNDKKGIERYSTVFTPMDEALSMVSVDISGRGYLVFNVPFKTEFIGNFETELIKEFFYAFAINSNITLHINLMYGENSHHIAESIFKGFGRALYSASRINENIEGVMSTKGSL